MADTIDRNAADIAGVWSAELTAHQDRRGHFVEAFRTTWPPGGFSVAQTNVSVSGRGVIRGVHYFADRTGQRKYVTCASGEALDVAVDLRLGSPTFGKWKALRMSADRPRAVLLSTGIGHAFMALSEQVAMLYLCDRPYVPGAESAINPLDPELALPWPADLAAIVSPRDSSAPTLDQARSDGLLARW